jgi:hypothetical protein
MKLERLPSFAHWVLAVLGATCLFASACADDSEALSDAGLDAGPDTDSDSDSDSDADTGCEPLPAPGAGESVIHVTAGEAADLPSIVNGASEGDTILLGDGTYALDGAYLWISAPGVTETRKLGDVPHYLTY